MPSIKKGRSYHASGLWAIKAKNGGKFPVIEKAAPKETTTTTTKPFGKQTRTVVSPKSPRFYPTEKVFTRKSSKKKHNPAKIRDSIQPGTVAIVLSGKFRGKRVVVLKRLSSGLALVSGPFKINGVPLRRYNPAYLIATSTKVDLTGVKFGVKAKQLKDAYFARPANPEDKSGNKENKKVTEERIQLQKAVDAQILTAVKKTPMLKEYLGSRFSLSKGQAPHLLKF